MTTEPATKGCPFCGETILAVAIKCKHCQSDLQAPAPAPVRSIAPQVVVTVTRKNTALGVVLALLFGPLGLLYSAPVVGLLGIPATLILVPLTVGIAWIPIILACACWAGFSTELHNAAIDAKLKGGKLRRVGAPPPPAALGSDGWRS